MAGNTTAMRGTGVLCTGVALAAVMAGAAVPAAAAGGTAEGISLARAVRSALAQVPAESYEQTGFAYMVSQQAPEAAFRWRWGSGPVAGMVPALEHATAGLSEGRVSWWRDELTPLPCAEAALCATVTAPQVPVELLVLATGDFYAYGTRSRHGCFGRLGGSVPLRIGDRVWTLYGEFAPPASHGPTELLKSVFPWGLTGGTATETATISARTHRPQRAQTLIIGASGNQFEINSSFAYPSHARAPVPTLCHPAA